MKAWIMLGLFLVSGVTAADYVATGPIEGQVCSGFIIESCKFHKLDAAKGSDGKLYALAVRYEQAEYDANKKRCWIRTKSTGSGVWSWAANVALQPEFYENVDGRYEKLDVEYVTFPCIKQ